jgi:hypothetical protein
LGEDDYAVVDETQVYETQIGRIYKERVPAGVKWLWFLQVVEAPLPNKGIADTLDEAKAALAKRYEEVKRWEMIGRNARSTEWRRPLKGHVLSPEQRPAVSTSPNQLSTLLRRFASARLPRSCLPGSMSRRFRNAHHNGFCPQQLAVAWDRLLITEPEGPSFISRTVAHHRVDRRCS